MSDWLFNFVGDWHALLALLLAGFLPNEVCLLYTSPSPRDS